MSAPSRDTAKAVHATYLLSFLGDVGVGLFSFAISLFAAVMLDGAGISGPEREFWVATVSMGWGIAYVFAPVLLGTVSDKIGRRPSLVAGMAGFIVVCLLVMLATHPVHLLLAFAAAGFCFGFFFPVLGAFSSEISSAAGSCRHGTVVSRFMIAWSIGLTAGPFIGGVFNAWLDHLAAFWCLAGISAVTMLVALTFIPARQTMSTVHAPPIEPRAGMMPATSTTSLAWVRFAILLMPLVFSFANHVLFTIFPAFAVVHVDAGPALAGVDMSFVAGLLVFILGIGRTVSFWHAGHLGNRARLACMIAAPAGMCAGTVLVFACPVAEILVLAFALYGLCSGYTFSIGLIMLMEISTTSKGLKAGIYEAVVGAGTLSASLLAIVTGQSNAAYPFLVAAIFCGIVFLLLAGSFAACRVRAARETVTEPIKRIGHG